MAVARYTGKSRLFGPSRVSLTVGGKLLWKNEERLWSAAAESFQMLMFYWRLAGKLGCTAWKCALTWKEGAHIMSAISA